MSNKSLNLRTYNVVKDIDAVLYEKGLNMLGTGAWKGVFDIIEKLLKDQESEVSK